MYQRLVAAMLESRAIRALRGFAPRASAGNASGPVFDAFISYKQAADRAVAVGVQRVLQSLGIPWWRRRAMHVFRDDTTLVPSSALWESIQKALQVSRNLVLLASPEAAASPWVDQEVEFWLTHRDLSSFYIAVTAGELIWDDAANDFVWGPQTPLPTMLRGRFKSQPLWIDLRPYRGASQQLGKSDHEFTSRVAGIAAGIQGRPKEDLLSEELSHQRRNLAWAWGAASSLAIIAAVAVFLKFEADARRDLALKTESRFLAGLARQKLENGDATAAAHIALSALPDASEGRDRPFVGDAQAALYRALEELRELRIIPTASDRHDNSLNVYSGDGRYLVMPVSTPAGLVPQLWNVATVEPVTSLPAHQGDVAIEFASGGARLITRQSRRSSPAADDNSGEPPEPAVGPDPTDAEDGLIRIFETETGRLVATLGTFDSFSLSPSERRLLTLAKGGQAALWDAATGQQVRTYQLPASTDSISFPASDATAAFRAGSASVQYFQISDGAFLTEEQARLVHARSQSGDAVIEKAGKVSPDGKRVVEGRDYKGNLRISLKAPGQEKPIAELETGGSAGVFDAMFSPDSQKLVTTAPFSQAKIWDARSGQLLHVLKGHSSFVTSVAFANDGRNVLTTSRDGSIRIWSADTGDELQVFSGHSDVPRHGHLSPDGARLLTVGESSARLWRGEPFRGPTLRFASPLTIRTDATVVSADGSRVLLVTTDNVLHVLSIGDQPSIRAIRVGAPGAQEWCEPSSNPAAMGRPSGAGTTAVAPVDSDQTMPNRQFWFTNDGMVLVGETEVSGPGETASGKCAWRANTGERVQPPAYRLSIDSDEGPDVHARSPLALALADGGALQVYDLERRRVVATLADAEAPVRSTSFDGEKALLTIGEDDVIRIFDPMTGRRRMVLNNERRKVERAYFASEGTRVFVKLDVSDVESASGAKSGDLLLYDAGTGALMKSYSLGYHKLFVSSPRHVAVMGVESSGGGENEKEHFVLVDSDTGKIVKELPTWDHRHIERDISRDGRRVFRTTAYRKYADGQSHIIEVDTGREIAALPTGIISTGGIYRDGHRAWTRPGRSTWGRSLRYPITIWDVDSAKLIVEIEGEIEDVRLDRSETVMMLRHRSGFFELRDAVDGHQIFATNPDAFKVQETFGFNGNRTLVLLLADARTPARRIDDDRTAIVTQVVLLDVRPYDQPIVAEAKQAVARCLTPGEAAANFLPEAPPLWCIGKWPYDSPETEQWAKDKRAGRSPKMPRQLQADR